jgi:hypothetical protein
MQPSISSTPPGTRRLWLGSIVVLATMCVVWAYGLVWLLAHATALLRSDPVGVTVVLSLGAIVVAVVGDWIRNVVPVVRHSWRPAADGIRRVSSGLLSLKDIVQVLPSVPTAPRVPDMRSLAAGDKPPVSACTPHESFNHPAPFRPTPSYLSLRVTRFSSAPPPA